MRQIYIQDTLTEITEVQCHGEVLDGTITLKSLVQGDPLQHCMVLPPRSKKKSHLENADNLPDTTHSDKARLRASNALALF